MNEKHKQVTRRDALAWLLRAGTGALVAAFAVKAASRPAGDRMVWQLDPRKCIQCGRCETECVLQPSAVKCVHGYAMCGYCKLCFGYFKPDAPRLTRRRRTRSAPPGRSGAPLSRARISSTTSTSRSARPAACA
jgi:Na+-translocating ferredoxin:NAD+ oxidoreductase subunit B